MREWILKHKTKHLAEEEKITNYQNGKLLHFNGYNQGGER